MKKTQNGIKHLLAVSVVMLAALTLAACQTPTPAAETSTPAALPTETTAAAAPTDGAPVPAATETPIVLDGAVTTESGLQYLEVVAGNGPAPQDGYIIDMQYTASLADGTLLASTYQDPRPASLVWGTDNLLPGWQEGIALMNEGEKAKIVIPPGLAFGPEGSGSIPPNAQIVIEMELLSVRPAPMPTTVEESKLIKTESGLQYADLVEGDGVQAEKNSNIATNYTLWVKTDTGYQYIDSSTGSLPIDIVIGRGDSVFPGWEEGATGMKVGGKRLLVVPPALGLGENTYGNIPANSTLVLEIELVDVREPQTITKVDEKDYTTTESGLKYYDITPGTGASPASGQTVVVHYTGWLEDGTQFDSSLDRGQPFSFQIGQGSVISGWDEGVASMKVGGKRQLVVPADLGYGSNGAGQLIPPNATLIFEVELLEIRP